MELRLQEGSSEHMDHALLGNADLICPQNRAMVIYQGVLLVETFVPGVIGGELLQRHQWLCLSSV